MEKDAEKVFRELKDDVSTYAELRLELLKINAYERIGKMIGILSYGLLLSALVLITLLFVMLTLGFLFSNLLGSTAAGIGIVAAFYLMLVVVVMVNKNRISLKVTNIIISALQSIDHKKDAKTKSGQDNDKAE